jgi:uncharacterized membrane protein YhaH (DUF805 family)
MGQITQATRSFFTLAGSIKGRRASRYEFWVGFALLFAAMILRNLLVELGTDSQAETPIWLLGMGAATTVLFVVPFVSLCIRRLQDAGLSAWFFAGIIVFLLVFSPAALVGLIALGSLPTRTKASHLINNDIDPSSALADNPVIGFSLRRLMKMLGLVIGLPLALILILGIVSYMTEFN